jgi:hypothetical protein
VRFRALKLAALVPGAGAGAKAALEAEFALQESLRALWAADRVKWLVTRGCGESAIPVPYPGFPWIRDPPDPLGPGNLRWEDEGEPEFRLELHRSPRASAARVWKESNEWKAEWVSPRF